jgi:hypothetical protein
VVSRPLARNRFLLRLIFTSSSYATVSSAAAACICTCWWNREKGLMDPVHHVFLRTRT